MKVLLLQFCFLIGITVLSFQLHAQKFTIRRLEVAGEKINLYYDLVDSVQSRTFTISVFSSHDNFISPLRKIKGDAGLEVKPGMNRKIVWDAGEELGRDFNSKVSIEIRGKVYVPFVRLDDLNKTFKRLSPTQITWTGGTEQNILNFDLYCGEEKITSFPNIANVGHHEITIPISVKPGSGYRFKITDSRNRDQIVYSPKFKVVRNVPLLLKAVPLAVVAAGVVIVATGNERVKDIPDPILP